MRLNRLFTDLDLSPLVITPEADASLPALQDYLALNVDKLRDMLTEHGGLLLRGFQLSGPDDFRRCVECLAAEPFGYVGGDSPRTKVAPDVFTATDYPATEDISLHNEMSYLPKWPTRLFFYSLVPAVSGGQTSLAYSADVLRDLPPSVVEKLKHKGVKYIRNFYQKHRLGKSWQSTYQTEDIKEVERIAAEQDSACEWTADGILRVSTQRSATLVHPKSGKECWFNQAEHWHPTSLHTDVRSTIEAMVGKGNMPHECQYGDGEPLEPEMLDKVRRVLASNKLLFDWRHNDVLMIDNVLMMHGREKFEGERKTLAYLSAS